MPACRVAVGGVEELSDGGTALQALSGASLSVGPACVSLVGLFPSLLQNGLERLNRSLPYTNFGSVPAPGRGG